VVRVGRLEGQQGLCELGQARDREREEGFFPQRGAEHIHSNRPDRGRQAGMYTCMVRARWGLFGATLH